MRSLALGCVLLACSQAWAVHRCTGPDGAAVFQDLPCAGKGQEVTVKPASGGYDQAAGDAARARLEADRTREDAERIERRTSLVRRPTATKQCPSSIEIRNMETAANSITLSEWDRMQRQRQIREARSCGY
jgi:hypothetical protein